MCNLHTFCCTPFKPNQCPALTGKLTQDRSEALSTNKRSTHDYSRIPNFESTLRKFDQHPKCKLSLTSRMNSESNPLQIGNLSSLSSLCSIPSIEWDGRCKSDYVYRTQSLPHQRVPNSNKLYRTQSHSGFINSYIKDPQPFHYHLPKCKSCGATNSSYAWEVVKDEKKRNMSSIYFSVDNLPQKCLDECEKVVKIKEKIVPVFKVPKIDTEFVESQEFNEDNYLADVNSFSSENQTVIEQPTFDAALGLNNEVSNTQFDTVHQNTPESSPKSGGCEIQKENVIDNEVFDVKSSLSDIFRAECVVITNEENNTSAEGEYHSFSDDFEESIYDSPVKELVEKDIRDYSVPIDFYCEDYFRREDIRSPRKSPAKKEPKIVLEPILEESKSSNDDSGLSCNATEKNDVSFADQIAKEEHKKECIDSNLIGTKEDLSELNIEEPQVTETEFNSKYSDSILNNRILFTKNVQDVIKSDEKKTVKYDREVDVFERNKNHEIEAKVTDAIDINVRNKHLFICTVYDDTAFSAKTEDSNEIVKNIMTDVFTKVETAIELKLEINNSGIKKISSVILAAKFSHNCCSNTPQDEDYEKAAYEIKSDTNSVPTAINVYTETETCVSDQQDIFNSICENVFEILSYDTFTKKDDYDTFTKKDDAYDGDIIVRSDAITEQKENVSTDGVSGRPTGNLKLTRKPSIESTISSVCAKSFDSTAEFEKYEEISDIISNILDKIDYKYDNKILSTAPKHRNFQIFRVKVPDSLIADENYTIGQDNEIQKSQIDTNKENCEAVQHDAAKTLDTHDSMHYEEEIINNVNLNRIHNSENQILYKTQVNSKTEFNKKIEKYEISNLPIDKVSPVLDLKAKPSCDYFSNSDISSVGSKNIIEDYISGNEPKLKTVLKSTPNDEECFVVQTESQTYFDSSDSKTHSSTESDQEDFSIAKIIQDMELVDFNETLATEISDTNLESTIIVEAILYYIFDEAFFVLGKKIKAPKKKRAKKVVTVADMEDILFTAKPLWSHCDLYEKYVNASEDVKLDESDVSFLFEENFAKDSVATCEKPITFEVPDHDIENVRLKTTNVDFVELNEEIKETQIIGHNIMSVDIEKHCEIDSTIHKNDMPKHEDVKFMVNDKITCIILEEIDITSTQFENCVLETNHTQGFNKAENDIEENLDFCKRGNYHDLNKSFFEDIKDNVEQENTSDGFDTQDSHIHAIFNKDDKDTENSTCNVKSSFKEIIGANTETTFIEKDSSETASEILQYILDESSKHISCKQCKENAKRGAEINNFLNETFVLEKTPEDMNTAFVEDTQCYSRCSSPNRKASVFQYCSVSPIRNPSDTFVGDDLSVLYEMDDTILGSPFVKHASIISMSQNENSGGIKYWISFDESIEGEPARERPKRLFDENKIPSFVCVDLKTKKRDRKFEALDKDSKNIRREGVLLQEFDNPECHLEDYRQTECHEQYFDDTTTNFYTNENNLQKESKFKYYERNCDRFCISEENFDNFNIYEDNFNLPETSQIFHDSENNVEKSNKLPATTIQDSFVTACASTDYTTCDSNNTHFEEPQKKLLYDSRMDLHTKVHRRQYGSWPPFEDTLFYRIISKFRMSESFDPSELESSKFDSSF